MEGEDDRIENLASQYDSRGGRRGGCGGRGRGRGGRGGASGGQSRDSDISRALSKLLRHQASSAGIKLDKEGYAPLDRVLQWDPLRALGPTLPEIQELVRSNDKQRFTLKPNPATNPALDEAAPDPAQWLIRANQGHSIKLESEGLLRPILLDTDLPSDPAIPPVGDAKDEAVVEPKEVGAAAPAPLPIPSTVVHGTYFCFWPAIEAAGGLKPMGRNHVHFSTGLPGAWAKKATGEGEPGGEASSAPDVISGMRKDAELLVYVDVARSIREAGIKWWMSDNGVVLTEGDESGLVPTKFFREVVGRNSDKVGVLWKDGEKVADIPPDVKGYVPRGKGKLVGLANKNSRRKGKGKGKGKGEGEKES